MDNFSNNNNFHNFDNQLANQAIISSARDSYNFVSEEQKSSKMVDKGKWNGLLKVLIILVIPILLTVLIGTFFKAKADNEIIDKENGIIMKIPMKETNWKDIGSVFEPLIEIPIKVNNGYEDWEFLLDSGAVISSLPRDWADKMGKDIDKMKRSVFKGFGGKTSFAYQGEMTVLLGEEDIEMPVVFTEASDTKSLIGRKGFFQQFSVYFNHKDKVIEIRK